MRPELPPAASPRPQLRLVALPLLPLLLAGLLAAGTVGCAGGPSGAGPGVAGPPAHDAPTSALEYLGMAVLPKGLVVDETLVGGLSALAYDPGTGVWLALSDDGSRQAPARLYRLDVTLGAAGRLGPDGVEVLSAGLLLGPDAAPYDAGTVDPEGMVLTAGDSLLVSSEGNAGAGLPPFLGEFSRTAGGGDLRVRRYFEVPRRFVPRRSEPGRGDDGRPRGVRHNLAFEALTLTPGGDLWMGTEGPLAQDGPRPAPGIGARARLLRYDVASGRAVGEVLYPLDPLPVPPVPEDDFAVNGLVELLALSDDDLLALERAYVAGRGHFLRLYRVSVAGAFDSSGIDALPRPGDEGAPPVLEKHLVLDLADLGEELFNVEGIAFGPELPDGRRLMLLVSDDNFAPEQRTQFFAFATDPERLATAPPPPAPTVAIAGVQGAGHVSPRVGRDVEVTGVVTATTPPGSRGGPPGGEVGLWIQDPEGDGDEATSEGLYVAAAPGWAGGALPDVEIGDRVRVRGRVVELGRRGGLPVTTLSLWPEGGVEVVEEAAGLPDPVRIGSGGLCPPGVIDDDRLTRFEPSSDGIDFWESLEGMALELAAPRVVGPTSRYGEIFAVADGCARGTVTVHGGLLLAPGEDHPERLALAPRLTPERAPELRVGQRFPGPLAGVLDYDFSNFRLLPAAWPVAEPAGWEVETTGLGTGEGAGLTVATLNLENLSVVDGPGKFARLAETVVAGLASPAIVGLQEVQDDSGARDDGVVTSAATLDRFSDAVVAAGGPRYAARWVDPENNGDGGRPGGNIRVAFLYDPARVDFVDRGSGGPGDGVALEVVDGRPSLDTSPGRLEPGNPVFENSRKALVAEVEVDGETLFLVNNHFSSKGGDAGLFGALQPPARPSDAARVGQARVVADFVGRLLAVDPGARVVVLGDLNDFPWRETLAPLGEVGLVNLMDRLPAADRYTYVWQGNSQVLDHVLVSPALAEGAEVDAVHRHADLPDSEKPSDHDPVVVRVQVRRP